MLDRRKEDNRLVDTHDRVIRLEVWVASIEQDITRISKLLHWILGMLGLVAVGVITNILIRQ